MTRGKLNVRGKLQQQEIRMEEKKLAMDAIAIGNTGIVVGTRR